MLGRAFRLIWWLLKPVRVVMRILFYLWLITFPIYGLHSIQGFLDGCIMTYLSEHYDNQGYSAFLSDMRGVRMFQSAELPGTPRIDEIGMEPFHIPLIRNPTEWWDRLGLERNLPVDDNGGDWDEFETVKQLANLQGLYRKQDDAGPWHHWVYASPSYTISGVGLYNDWDIAFDELLRYHYANPPANNATFRAIACGRSSLTKFWRLEGPALLHFSTESDQQFLVDDDSVIISAMGDGTYEEEAYPKLPGLDKVYVRIVKLPLKKMDEELVVMKPGVFPSQFEQLRIITSDDRIWQHYERFYPPGLLFDRMDDFCKQLEKDWPQTYGRLVSTSDYVTKYLGLEQGGLFAEFLPYTIGLHTGVFFATIPMAIYTIFVDPGITHLDRTRAAILAVLRETKSRSKVPSYDAAFGDAMDKVLKSAAAAAATAAAASSRPSPGA